MAKIKCLIVERHEWETGALQHQLQIPLDIATSFFGSGDVNRPIAVRVFLPLTAQHPAFERNITISREYEKSATRRVNRFHEMGAVPSSFVFFQETDAADHYDVWWQTDKAIVAAHYNGWQQGHSSQYGRGRLAIIVPGPVPRPITSIH